MMMKTLLLGAAAGLVTVGAAQAADLPMTKAEAVEYVKVCTEFGEGFFYIPGTDTCLKISGEVRANYRFFDRLTRQTDVTQFSTEPRLKFDARTATEYGTLRSYIQLNMPVSAGSDGSAFNLDKAFIQFGGLTAGYAHTFFGIYDADYGNTIFAPYYSSQSTVNLLAYTAVFGGGFSATLSVEDGRNHRSGGGLGAVDNADGALVGILGLPTGTVTEAPYGGQSVPDFVAQLRLDGEWGEAAVFGAVHQIRYPATELVTAPIFGAYEPQDANFGFAVGAGVGYKLPFMAGSHIALEGTYASGANNYLGFGGRDGLFGTELPFDTDSGSGWSITGEFGVDISPVFNVTAFGSYLDYTGGSITGDSGFITDAGLPILSTFEGLDAQNWVAGINATYTVVPGLTIQPEVYYQSQEISNSSGTASESLDTWQGGVRIKRIF